MAIVQTLRDMVWLLLHPLPRDIKNQDYDFQIMILLVAMNYLSSSLFNFMCLFTSYSKLSFCILVK